MSNHTLTGARTTGAKCAFLLLICVFFTVVAAAAEAAVLDEPPAAGAALHRGQALAEFSAGVSLAEARQAVASCQATFLREVPRWGVTDGTHLYAVQSEDASSRALAADLAALPLVTRAAPDGPLSADLVPNDASRRNQWGLGYLGAYGAWDLTTGSSSTVVAVLDTGIELTHPDLAADLWQNPGEIAGNGLDDDGDGYVDDVYGIDTYNHDSDPSDDFFHGTHVAGIIGAVGNNGIGVAGLSWRTRLMALKCLGASDTIGTNASAIEAVTYTIRQKLERGVNVVAINTSWGGAPFPHDPFLEDAVRAAGAADIVWCCSAGNEGRDTDIVPRYPSCYDSPNIISVAASDYRPAERLTDWTNWGAQTVDLAAPGQDIYSTNLGGGYRWASGTSMAAPQVAGAIALCAAYYPTETALQRVDRILSGVDQLDSMTGLVKTGGRLEVNESLRADLRPLTTAAGIGLSWSKTPVFVAFAADDGTGIGVDHTEYTLDGSGWTTGQVAPVATDGVHTVVYRSVDKAGNIEAAKSGVVKVDATPPEVAVTGGESGLCQGPVTLHLSASDATSGLASFEYRLDPADEWVAGDPAGTDVTVAGAGVHTAQWRAADVAGNSTSVGERVVRIDDTPPAVSASGADDAWHREAVTVTLTASGAPGTITIAYREAGADEWTSVNALRTVITVSATDNDGVHVYEYRAGDAAGNTSGAGSFAVKIDATPPTAVATGGETDLWTPGPVTLRLTAADATSGLASFEYRLGPADEWVAADPGGTDVMVAAEGAHRVQYRAVDPAGNSSGVLERLVRIDASAPTVRAAGADSAWHNAAVSVTLTATDAGLPDASGVAGIDYREGEGAWTQVYAAGTVVTVAASANNGVHVYQFRARDLAGNTSATGSFTVKIDTTAPISVLGGVDNAWHNTAVQPTLAASDAGSGVARLEYSLNGGAWKTGPIAAIKTQGSTTVGYRAIDAAGNIEVARSATVRYDSVAPTTQVTSSSVVRSSVATLTYRVDDKTPNSGQAVAEKIVIYTAAGATVKTITLGATVPVGVARTYAFTCTLARGTYKVAAYAHDLAGNAATSRTVGTLTVR